MMMQCKHHDLTEAYSDGRCKECVREKNKRNNKIYNQYRNAGKAGQQYHQQLKSETRHIEHYHGWQPWMNDYADACWQSHHITYGRDVRHIKTGEQ